MIVSGANRELVRPRGALHLGVEGGACQLCFGCYGPVLVGHSSGALEQVVGFVNGDVVWSVLPVDLVFAEPGFANGRCGLESVSAFGTERFEGVKTCVGVEVN